MTLTAETACNFAKFRGAASAQVIANYTTLSTSPHLLLSYRRISAINSLKMDVLDPILPKEALAFFHEAHNDALASHVNASVGSWRSALKSLRSCLENSFACFFFMDHPVELRKWAMGRHKTWFAELRQYYEEHPDLTPCALTTPLLLQAKKEYAELSSAVHASSKSFRMTDDIGKVLLWSADNAKLGKWSKREGEVLSSIALLTLILFKERFRGTAHGGTREALGFLFSVGMRKKIRNELNIKVSQPA